MARKKMANKRALTDDENEGDEKRFCASGSTTPVVDQTQKKEIDLIYSKAPFKTRKRKMKGVFMPQHSNVTFSDVGGVDHLLKELLDMFLHYKIPAFYQKVGCLPVRSILLHGPPGCGKTLIAHAIAGELKIPIIKVASTEFIYGGNTIRDAFHFALATGRCLLFFDEIDAICPKRETIYNLMNNRMLAQMTNCLDELYVKDPDANVIVVGATNAPDDMDLSLRRGKRFDNELAVGIPNEDARLKILQILCKDIKLSPNFDLQWLAHNTPGYVGADLYTLISKATKNGFKRMKKTLIECTATENIESTIDSRGGSSDLEESLENAITFYQSVEISDEEADKFYFIDEDFQVALPQCTPYYKREGFVSGPNTSWNDICALEHVKEELKEDIMGPVQHRKFHKRHEISSSSGILLYGPKGCGKSLLAKAIANECGINFISVKGPELLSMYVGESGKAVRRCFERARNSAPCVIFFDEFDALCPPRSSSRENSPTEKVVNTLLAEACRAEDGRNQVFLIAATNRLENLDSAILGPGRLGKIIYVGLPTPAGRLEILKSISKKKTFEEGLDLVVEKVAFDPRSDNFSGADLVNLLEVATKKAMKESFSSPENQNLVICWRHFDEALNVAKPSNSEEDRRYFEKSSSHHSRTK